MLSADWNFRLSSVLFFPRDFVANNAWLLSITVDCQSKGTGPGAFARGVRRRGAGPTSFIESWSSTSID
jgi:hypothetical protein